MYHVKYQLFCSLLCHKTCFRNFPTVLHFSTFASAEQQKTFACPSAFMIFLPKFAEILNASSYTSEAHKLKNALISYGIFIHESHNLLAPIHTQSGKGKVVRDVI